MESVYLFQVSRNSGLSVGGKPQPDIDQQQLLSVTFHSMFVFIRSNDLKLSFCEIVLKTVEGKAKGLNKSTEELVDALLAWVVAPKSTEAKYLAPLFCKVPSKAYVELIWNLRETVIQLARKESHHFKSIEGVTLPNGDLPKLLDSLAGVREVRRESVEGAFEQQLRPENARGTVDANQVILTVARQFELFNCYALRPAGPFIPTGRSVNAYVYMCFKGQ